MYASSYPTAGVGQRERVRIDRPEPRRAFDYVAPPRAQAGGSSGSTSSGAAGQRGSQQQRQARPQGTAPGGGAAGAQAHGQFKPRPNANPYGVLGPEHFGLPKHVPAAPPPGARAQRVGETYRGPGAKNPYSPAGGRQGGHRGGANRGGDDDPAEMDADDAFAFMKKDAVVLRRSRGPFWLEFTSNWLMFFP